MFRYQVQAHEQYGVPYYIYGVLNANNELVAGGRFMSVSHATSAAIRTVNALNNMMGA